MFDEKMLFHRFLTMFSLKKKITGKFDIFEKRDWFTSEMLVEERTTSQISKERKFLLKKNLPKDDKHTSLLTVSC